MSCQILEQVNVKAQSRKTGRKEFSFTIRVLIEQKLAMGLSITQIAKELHCNKSSISREVNKLPKGQYSAVEADKIRQANVKRRGRKSKLTPEIRKEIVEQMKLGRTPEQITGGILKISLSFQAIYYWIKHKILNISRKLLVRKGKQYRAEEYRGKLPIPKENTIDQRPDFIKLRETFGHWEIDTVNPARGKGKSCFLTIVERLTRFYVCIKMPDRTAESVYKAVEQFVATYGINAVKSITADRGKEFACFKKIEELGPKFYFCNPYKPQERGSNENANGLLRRYFPKKMSFEHVTQEELDKVVDQINSIPKKIHGFKPTKDIFGGYLILSKVLKPGIEIFANVG